MGEFRMASGSVRYSAFTAVVCLMLMVSGLSCGGPKIKNRKPTFQVSGRVLVQSQPAEGALIIFRPLAGADTPDEWTLGFPRATVKADGSFVLETYGTEDGAPAGDYVVLVNWPPAPNPERRGEEPTGEDRLGRRYLDPNNSLLRAKVEARQNVLPAFELN